MESCPGRGCVCPQEVQAAGSQDLHSAGPVQADPFPLQLERLQRLHVLTVAMCVELCGCHNGITPLC